VNRNFYPLLWIFSLFLFACGQKKEILEKDPLSFSIEQIKDLNTGIYPVRYELHFKNESDSGEDISYRWRFGDGGAADGYNTNHAYLESGNYTVWLTKYKAGLAIDSNYIAIKVDAIPIIIRQNDLFYSHPVAIGAFENKVYLAGIHPFPYKENVGYREESYLTQYDSLWREQWTKTFPEEIGEITNMSITANGDVLLTVIKSREKSRLYRIDGNGNVKWTWTTPSDIMSIYCATEDKQGNIVIMCTKPVSPSWANITIQLDASGKENWTYDWGTNDMNFCYKLVTLADGYIMTGSSFCVEPCLHIARLSLDGKNVWNANVPKGKSNDIGNRLGVYTVLDQSNQLQVFCGAAYTYHTFDLNGKHLGSRDLSVKMAPRDVLVNKTGSVLVAGDQLIDGTSKATLLELKPNNTTGWVYNSFTSIINLDLAQYPRYTRSTSVVALTDKNVALFAGHFSWYRSSSGEYYATFVCLVDANGKLF
jgi:PKD repeat protein